MCNTIKMLLATQYGQQKDNTKNEELWRLALITTSNETFTVNEITRLDNDIQI